MYEIEYIKPIPKEIRQITYRYLEVLDEISPVEHPLFIYVLPVSYFHTPEHGECLGLFSYTPGYDDDLEILLAGRQDPDEYKMSLVHEMVHYHQFRDGRPVKEGGVKVRARNLIKLVENELTLAI